MLSFMTYYSKKFYESMCIRTQYSFSMLNVSRPWKYMEPSFYAQNIKYFLLHKSLHNSSLLLRQLASNYCSSIHFLASSHR